MLCSTEHSGNAVLSIVHQVLEGNIFPNGEKSRHFDPSTYQAMTHVPREAIAEMTQVQDSSLYKEN